MKMPKLLHPGDLVAITAASGPCDPAKLAIGVKIIENLGLKVQVMPSCYARHDYLAGTDALRLSNLHEAFAAKEVCAIFMARGGYGAARLLPHLNYALIRQNPKPLIGFSDVTALHIAINQNCGLITFHGPMPATAFEPDALTIASLCNNIFASSTTPLHPPPTTTIVSGKAEGILTGGNLSVIAASLGTPYEIKTRGRILFLEEIQESPYRVDRLLLQLQQAGKLNDAAGIILGDFSPETLETLSTAIKEIIIPENKPTIANLPCGHTTPNITLPLGGWAKINAEASMESAHQLEIHAHPEILGVHKQS